jgi:hypothetical protein
MPAARLPDKILRPYQARLLTDVCRVSGDVLVEQPTGSGKTLAIVSLVALQLGRRFTHALISAPQEQIEHCFVHRDYQRVAWSQSPGVAGPAVEVPEEMIWGARQSQLGSVKRLLAYLRQAPPVDHALACTHAALNHLAAEDLPDEGRDYEPASALLKRIRVERVAPPAKQRLPRKAKTAGTRAPSPR